MGISWRQDQPGEKPEAALHRELEEELGILAVIGRRVATISHRYSPESQVELQFFLVQQFEREIQNLIFRDVRWVEKHELPTYKFLQADIKLVQQLAAGKLL